MGHLPPSSDADAVQEDHAVTLLDGATPGVIDDGSTPAESPVVDETGAAATPAPLAPGDVERDLTIGRDETFYDAVRRLGGTHREIMALVKAVKPYRDLKKVHRGDAFRISLAVDGGVDRLSFDLEDQESYITLQRNADGGYDAYELTYPVEHLVAGIAGTVDSSLFESLAASGAPTALASKMNDILGWEVDFRRDVRKGDRYRILYEEVRKNGEFLRTGPILAAEYVNAGDAYRGYRYTNSDGHPGYYDRTGRNLEKQLLRAPLEYSRISDGFTSRRFHPVRHRWMPHYGVDYAAPVGTPVRAGGNGTIAAATYDRNNGRYIRIVHDNRTYQTYYLHLSRFAKGIRKGKHVTQGQVVGYVGATGIATGPHLDYRVRKDGSWVNPRTLKLPASAPVDNADLASFQSTAALYSYCLAAQPDEGGPYRMALLSPLLPPYQATLLAAPTEQSTVLASTAVAAP